MQVTKYAFFLVLGIAAQACGGGSDGDGGGGDESSGGSTGNGGSTGKGGSTGNGGSSSGTTGNGGSSSGTTGVGGTTGSGTCPAGTVDGYDDWYGIPACKSYFDCIIKFSCSNSPDQAACTSDAKAQLQTAFCVPEGSMITPATAGPACESALAQVMALCP